MSISGISSSRFIAEERVESNIPGNGLGLHLVKRIMQAQGGRVTFNRAPHGGASFHASRPGRIMSRARILLVEDESNLRRILSDLLKSDGYTVQSSGDGLEAQELAMSQPFDLIILDVMLPSTKRHRRVPSPAKKRRQYTDSHADGQKRTQQ